MNSRYDFLILHLLSRYLSSRLVPVAGRERKVYKATESGIDYIAHKKEKWYRWEEFANSILEL